MSELASSVKRARTLVRVAKAAEDRAAAAVSQAQARVNQLHEQCQQAQRQLDTVRQAPVINGADLLSAQSTGAAVASKARQLQVAHDEALVQLEQARAGLLAARADREGRERLLARRQEAYVAHVVEAEQRAIDDVAKRRSPQL